MGWSSAELHVLRGTSLTPAAWDVIVRVSVATSPDIAIAARHTATTETVDVIPQFGLDPGREYVVRIDASQIPTTTAATSRSSVPTVSRLTVPDRPVSAATQVTAIYPSAAVWPENILRFYLHFSQPMSGTSAVGHVRLVDDQGADIADALLEVDVDLWSGDYIRRTVFFDPGRVKRDIRPNREMGRALVAGRQYAIVVSREWRDSTGQSLGEEFRHAFTAGPAVEEGLQLSEWTLSQPSAGSRQDLRSVSVAPRRRSAPPCSRRHARRWHARGGRGRCGARRKILDIYSLGRLGGSPACGRCVDPARRPVGQHGW